MSPFDHHMHASDTHQKASGPGEFPAGSAWEGGKLSFVLAASMSDGTQRFIH